jgi:hypothetical protein
MLTLFNYVNSFIPGERLPPITAKFVVRLPVAEVQVVQRLAKALGRLHPLVLVLLQDLPGKTQMISFLRHGLISKSDLRQGSYLVLLHKVIWS